MDEKGSVAGAGAAGPDAGAAQAAAERRPRILVVDNDASVRAALAVTLADHGFDVVCAADVAQGARHCRRGRVDLLVADIYMPGNERLEWLRELAAERPSLPILVITGRPALDTAIAAVSLPIRAYLVKPVTSERLVAEIRRALGERQADPGHREERIERLCGHWQITHRERAVLAELVAGAANKEIAARLGCAVRTVEDHVSALLRKSGAGNRNALVARVWDEGSPPNRTLAAGHPPAALRPRSSAPPAEQA